MDQPPISDYAFLSDCRSGALVGRDGSIDWWCPDRFDGAAVLGRVLDPAAGHWRLAPLAPSRVERAYRPDTLVLRTVHHTPAGSVAVTDALAAESGARGHELGMNSPAVLLRVVEGLTGRVRMGLDLAPRPEHGLLTPYLHEQADGSVLAAAGPAVLVLAGTGPALRADRDRVRQEFTVAAGETVGFTLAYAPAYGGPPVRLDPVAALTDTTRAWQAFRESHHYEGEYVPQVRHSAVVLTGLTYARSGAVAAALTTSLPERLGGDRNYDYRFSWLRDFASTMRALWVAACPEEASRLFAWAARSIGRIGDAPVPVLFGLEGERDLSEHDCPHLRGYADSRPVRLGNDAWRQRQLDVPGEVISAVWRLHEQLGDTLADELAEMVVGLADQVATTWRLPDRGMWETRDADRHYLSSKVLCWVALNRAVALAPQLGGRADPGRWAATRDEIRVMVLREGWNERVGAYTGAFGSPELDASALLLPLVRFADATEPRMRATIEAVERELGAGDGLVRRWSTDPAGFPLCSFWLVECRVLTGERDRARRLFERLLGHANDVGLLPEQIDPGSGLHLGNTPQALSHIGLVNAAWRLTDPTTS
ncbi:glycoside hydrolase family 15 protein [Micromonospora carbonacea]|uniref:Glycoside hydrolase family 15 protein n=1 Tax=Micromonospora carbonacea TaxID=47853 RepID=A0A7H8XJK6_9ACTN|nr:glycoside hydrolase family 15 protein [Micromonospora carbonacea]MBB5828387.1 GH15 family glucan-1,4-alpha-glucosidase [Micromonospora carbonacea]QLD24002.1 glycoside hydrolase family 15 protein [Micromonospora carbonacea]